jgi:U3 small nucleolar RNA-associated protein 15
VKGCCAGQGEQGKGRGEAEERTAALGAQGAPPTHVSFAENATEDFAVTSGLRVSVFHGVTGQVRRTLGMFKDVAACGSFREDGSLVAAGGREGLVRVCNVRSRGVLRVFSGHRGPVLATGFATGGRQVLSGGDDRSVRVWDVATDACVWSVEGAHADYVRSVVGRSESAWEFVSASFDGSVHLWDTRVPSSAESAAAPVAVCKHQAPVTSVAIVPGGTSLVSAGGAFVRVWDFRQCSAPRVSAEPHAKGTTAVACDAGASRLLSAGLDSSVRVLDLASGSLRVLHTIRCDAPVVSLGLSASSRRLIVGLEDGALVVRLRDDDAAAAAAVAAASHGPDEGRFVVGGSHAYYERGQGLRRVHEHEEAVPMHPLRAADLALATDADAPLAADAPAQTAGKPKLRAFDALLKRFQYGAALDAAFATHEPAVQAALVVELVRRNGLRNALAGRNADTLSPILAAASNHIADPRYTDSFCNLVATALDLYAPVVGSDPDFDAILRRVEARLAASAHVRGRLAAVAGILDGALGTIAALHAVEESARDRPGTPSLPRSEASDAEDVLIIHTTTATATAAATATATAAAAAALDTPAAPAPPPEAPQLPNRKRDRDAAADGAAKGGGRRRKA